jgi:hypothetical protein
VTGYTVTQASTTAAVGAPPTWWHPTAAATTPAFGGVGRSAGNRRNNLPEARNLHRPKRHQLSQCFSARPGRRSAKILLTAANGNFTVGSYPQSSGTAFGPGPAGKGGDEGSAVLDVSKNGYPSGSSSPYGFYAEYLTIQNTYDTDTVTTSTTTASGNGGTCNFSGTTPYTLQYLYNNNLSCGSQAQALFMNADQAILNNVNLISQQDTLYAGYQGTAAAPTFHPANISGKD